MSGFIILVSIVVGFMYGGLLGAVLAPILLYFVAVGLLTMFDN
jgi:hypothetical protein